MLFITSMILNCEKKLLMRIQFGNNFFSAILKSWKTAAKKPTANNIFANPGFPVSY